MGLAALMVLVGGDDGVEGLGFAAGGDGGALDDGGVGMREGLAVEGAEMEEDVEMREGGFLEGEGGGAGEMAVGEVEEGEGAEGFGGPWWSRDSAVARKLCAARLRSTSV